MKENDVQIGLKVAWHGLTTIVDKVTEFPFELLRVACQMEGKDVEGWNWIIGSDDRQIIVKPVANSFQFLANSRWLEIVNNSMADIPGSVIESLGTFGGRAKRYTSLRLGTGKESYRIGNREFQTRLNFQGAIDGTMCDIVKGSNTCIVCANTFGMSLGESSEVNLRAKHTANHADKWAGIEESIEAYFLRSADFERLMTTAAEMPMVQERAHMIALGWLAMGKETSTRTLNTAKRIGELFQSGKGNEGSTGLDLISAVTDYYSHESSGGDDRMKQFTSSEIGAGARAKDQFLVDVRTKDFRFNKSAIASMAKAGELTLSLSAKD